jgi:Ni/Co efflux regulator RcnB
MPFNDANFPVETYHDLRPGDRLPVAYWDGRHHVRNWQRARLPAPKPGCNRVRVGDDFVQSSVYTGKITAILVRS